ncbi:MAG: hypothetical protein LT070_08490 [Solirubrobacteraceae bacterium]|nr:hypothetical protein [Solirubrobacteraceae bacterium]
MGYRIIGRMHAALHHALRDARSQSGQGTVEYVALILLVAGVLAGVIAVAGGLKGGGIAQAVVGKMKAAIEEVGRGGR